MKRIFLVTIIVCTALSVCASLESSKPSQEKPIEIGKPLIMGHKIVHLEDRSFVYDEDGYTHHNYYYVANLDNGDKIIATQWDRRSFMGPIIVEKVDAQGQVHGNLPKPVYWQLRCLCEKQKPTK